MKDFRTELKMRPSENPIGLKSRILTQGSCFADAIGERLGTFKLQTMANPFGVIYNPESIHKALSYGIFNEPVPDHTFLQNHEVYLNYNFHSTFSALQPRDLSVRRTFRCNVRGLSRRRCCLQLPKTVSDLRSLLAASRSRATVPVRSGRCGMICRIQSKPHAMKFDRRTAMKLGAAAAVTPTRRTPSMSDRNWCVR